MRLPVWFWIWAALAGAVLVLRPALPIDETRYLAVAWEMWWRDSVAVPYLNGNYYDGKPPLFFWLMHLGWLVSGVNEWWPRALAPLFGLADLILVQAVARRLWPSHAAAAHAPLILLGSFYWAVFCASTMFDVLLGFFALLSVYALIRVWQGGGTRFFALAGAALGFGILTKGPVVFLPALFIVIAAPWWMASGRPAHLSWRRWYYGALGAAGVAALVACAWLVPAALAGDPFYVDSMLFKQIGGYVSHSFSHPRPVWWYLPLLPALLYPWSCWPRAWRAIGTPGAALHDPGVRLCLVWAVPVLIVFSLISGKQAHYPLLMFPAVALLLARLLPEVEKGRDYSLLVAAGVTIVAGSAVIVAAAADMFSLWKAAWLARMPSAIPYVTGACLIGIGLAAGAACRANLGTRIKVLAAASCAVVIVLTAAFMRASESAYDMRPTSSYLSTLETEGAPLAITASYSGEFNFYGRLKTRIEPLLLHAALVWATAHPHGYVMTVIDSNDWPPLQEPRPVYQSLHRGGGIAVWRARDFVRGTLRPAFSQ